LFPIFGLLASSSSNPPTCARGEGVAARSHPWGADQTTKERRVCARTRRYARDSASSVGQSEGPSARPSTPRITSTVGLYRPSGFLASIPNRRHGIGGKDRSRHLTTHYGARELVDVRAHPPAQAAAAVDYRTAADNALPSAPPKCSAPVVHSRDAKRATITTTYKQRQGLADTPRAPTNVPARRTFTGIRVSARG
jgi:hypothetical protein